MRSISGTVWHIEYLRTPGYRSRKDCCYYSDGNCLKLNGVCQGIKFCGKYKESLDASDKKKRRKKPRSTEGLVQCSFCGKYMTPEELRTHWKTCDWEYSRKPAKTSKKKKKNEERLKCPYCGSFVRVKAYDRHLSKKCPKSPLRIITDKENNQGPLEQKSV